MRSANDDVKCLSRSAEVGMIGRGGFAHGPACDRPLPDRGGRLCCCRCVGPLYLEPNLKPELVPVDWARVAGEIEGDVA